MASVIVVLGVITITSAPALAPSSGCRAAIRREDRMRGSLRLDAPDTSAQSSSDAGGHQRIRLGLAGSRFAPLAA